MASMELRLRPSMVALALAMVAMVVLQEAAATNGGSKGGSDGGSYGGGSGKRMYL